jgi:DNA-binding MarR family transcriptional regulator/GNAT superfamily N-acetyltransferase
MKLEIIPLVNADCKAVIDLILPIQQIEFNVPVTLEDQPDLQDIEAFYRRGGGDFWGAFIGDHLAGTIALISTGHQAGTIRKMFVRKEYRGKEWGIAQQLLQTLISYCDRNQITDLYLGTVEILKAAHRFYEKNGFHRINKADLPSYFPLMEVDNVFYHAHLPKLPPANIIDEAGTLAIATRMQRLSDRMRRDGLLIYKACGIDFEPKWFPVIYTLHNKPVLSVVEIAAEIGYAHPSTISLLKELEKQKLIRSKRDMADERKRLIQLTAKGKTLIEQMKPVWEVMVVATRELIDTKNNLMQAIIETEEAFDKQSFLQRARRHMVTSKTKKV